MSRTQKVDRGAVRGDRAGRRRTWEGMTVLETVIAIFLLSMFIAGMMGVLLAVREASDRARWHYAAINVAKNRLERIQTFEFTQLSFFTEANTRVDNNGQPNGDGRFRRTTTFGPVKTNLVEVAISVEIMDPLSLTFEGEKESVKSYVANITRIME